MHYTNKCNECDKIYITRDAWAIFCSAECESNNENKAGHEARMKARLWWHAENKEEKTTEQPNKPKYITNREFPFFN